jgi:hypothetical protein
VSCVHIGFIFGKLCKKEELGDETFHEGLSWDVILFWTLIYSYLIPPSDEMCEKHLNEIEIVQMFPFTWQELELKVKLVTFKS